MKLVEILASGVSKWHDRTGRLHQDGDGRIYATRGKMPKFHKEWNEWDVAGRAVIMNGADPIYGDLLDLADDYKTKVVTRAQWQAERDRQKGGEWKRHRGGAKPASVSDGDMVEARLRCGDTQTACAGKFLWNHADCDHSVNITKYRVISQPQAEEVEAKDTTIGTLSLKVEVDTSDATQAIDELAAKWDQIETPFKWRDEVNELDAYIEKYTRERDALIERLASEGFALIPPVVSVVSEFAGDDMSDWRNWKAGDIVECTYSDCENVYTVGNHYDVHSVTSAYAKVSDDCGVGSHCNITDDDNASVRFIRC